MSQPHVLIVEDEPAQREVLAYNLEAEGFRISRAEDGEQGLLLVDEDTPDVIVLDWMLPNVSGIEVCRQLKMRPDTRAIPILMLSAKSALAELMARIRTQLRRVRPSTVGQVLTFDDIALDPETHRVTRGDTALKLGPTEFRLLTTFMEKPGRVWSRDQLLDRVWGREIYVDTRTVDVHVGRLRKILKQNGGSDPVRTVRGAGYALG